MGERFIEKPVFICGHRKGGTTLLINLLDSHPELIVFPDDSGFFYMYHPIVSDGSKEEKMEAMLTKVLGRLEESVDKVGGEVDVDKVRKDFKKNAEYTEMTPKDVLKAAILALKNNSKNTEDPKAWVEKTTTSEVYAMDILKWFPEARFIHVVRDPRDNWGSLKSGWEKRYKDFNDSEERLKQSLIERAKLGMEMAIHNKEMFPDQYKVIRYEDLVNEPEKIMKDVCDFIGIRFTDSVMQPTICGKSWKGNNFNKKFEGISNASAGKWKERISEEDAKLIEYHFRELMDHFGYKREYSLKETVNATKEHYKWFNFSQPNSYSKDIKNVGVKKEASDR